MTARALASAGAVPSRARHGLVLLHGRGGSAGDILSLLDAAGLPDVAAVAPEATGNSWWPTSFLVPHAQIEPFLTDALAAVDDAVAALVAAGLPRSRIRIAGFSQGACLALEYLARSGGGDAAGVEPLAGGFGFSGGLVGTADAPGGGQAALYGHGPKSFGYPVQPAGADLWISVHETDPHIPIRRVEETAAVFRSLGARVERRVYSGAGHAVMRDDIAALRARLNGAD